LASILREGGEENNPSLFVSRPRYCSADDSTVGDSDHRVVFLARSQNLRKPIDRLKSVGLGAFPQLKHGVGISRVVFAYTKRHRGFLTR
jgi:hypothetical protein